MLIKHNDYMWDTLQQCVGQPLLLLCMLCFDQALDRSFFETDFETNNSTKSRKKRNKSQPTVSKSIKKRGQADLNTRPSCTRARISAHAYYTGDSRESTTFSLPLQLCCVFRVNTSTNGRLKTTGQCML